MLQEAALKQPFARIRSAPLRVAYASYWAELVNIIAEFFARSRSQPMSSDSTPTYEMHELVRQYGAARLAEAGETEACHQWYFDYYWKRAEQNEAELFSGDSFSAFRWLILEQPNLQTALEWASREHLCDQRKMMRLRLLMHPEFHKTGVPDALHQLHGPGSVDPPHE